MIDLSGHTALVTGSTQGVGAAIAQSLSQAGAQVLLHGLVDDDLARDTLQKCRRHHPEASLHCCDLAVDAARLHAEFVEPILQRYPALDLLVLNAGVFVDTPFLQMTEALFHRTFDINVKSGFFLAQSFARHWVANGIAGRMVFTGSINGLLAEPDHVAYDASKAAVAGLVRSLCVALAPHRIRVNSIAPGLVRTPLTNQILARDPVALEWMQLHTPNGQVPEASVCGPMTAFLLSDLAEHIHGQTIYIDGGMGAWQQPDVPERFRRGTRSQP
jgi:NAD(P)-dependent dehydrogenase (short-subunit alcohol dehydrogenase family)